MEQIPTHKTRKRGSSTNTVHPAATAVALHSKARPYRP
jgi:hypothetical protein